METQQNFKLDVEIKEKVKPKKFNSNFLEKFMNINIQDKKNNENICNIYNIYFSIGR